MTIKEEETLFQSQNGLILVKTEKQGKKGGIEVSIPKWSDFSWYSIYNPATKAASFNPKMV